MTEQEIETHINSNHLTGDYAEGFRAALKLAYKEKHDMITLCNEKLSKRQIELLSFAFLPSPLIADRLHISPHTVYSHYKNIRREMGFKDKRDMVRFATIAGILKTDK